jgi:hypothetical protein
MLGGVYSATPSACRMASPTIANSNHLIAWLRMMEALRKALAA